MKQIATDLYALQAKQIEADWETKKVYFTDKYAFLREQLDELTALAQQTDTRYRILCLSTNETMYEVTANA